MTRKILAICFALLYSIIYIVVGPSIKAQSANIDILLIFRFLMCFGLCSVINIHLFSVIPQWHYSIRSERISRFFDKLGNRKLFLLVWGFIFMAWIPAYLVLYPGVLSYDILSQTAAAWGEINNNHHPVLHTWLIRFFMKIGDGLFSSYEFGIGLLSLVQMVILSFALARLVMLLRRKNVSSLIVLFTALFSAFWFMNACLSVTMIKDTLHAAFLVLFVCHFTEIIINPSEYSKQKYNLIIFPLIVFLMCALRNNGIHIYVFCIAGLSVLRMVQIKKVKMYIALVVSIIMPVFAYKIYTGPVFDALDIKQGEVREALSVPIQQLQRVAVGKADELTSEQMYKMDYYIDNLAWREWNPGRQYNPFFADPAKSSFYSARYEEDPIAFWKFYLQIGKQYTKEYVVAFLSNTLGFWYPGYYEYSYVMYDNYPTELFVEPLERKTIWDSQFLKKYYESVCSSDFWRETPVLRLFFVPGFSIWILAYALILTWRKRGYFTKVLPLFLPMIAQYGIMILSPMSSFRYSWPFYLMLPLVFIAIWGNTESFIAEEKGAEAPESSKDEIRSI